MNRNPDQEIEQIEQGLEAFLEQETYDLQEKQMFCDRSAKKARGGQDGFDIKTDMLPESQQRVRREESHSPAGISRPSAVPSRPSEETARSSSDPSGPRTARPSEKTARPSAGSPRPQPERPAAKAPRPPKRRRPDAYERDYEDRRKRSDEDGYEDSYEDDYEDDYEDEREDDYEERRPSSRPKKRRKKKSVLKRLLLFLLILCVLAGGLWYFAVGRVYKMMQYEEISALAAQPLREDGVINILLIGNDSRSQGEDGRSDAMILLSISKRTKTIHMMSLLRDIYVEIPGHEGNRLNAAYSFGGPELLLETLKLNFDLEVNRYVLVNFQAFAGVVDAVGGVDLDLTNEEVQYVNGYLTEYNALEGRPEGTDYLDNMAVGTLHLNGPQALAYCRIRYIGTDFGRTERQREVLSAVMRKAPKAMLTNPTGLLGGLLPNLTTNLTESECRQLSLELFNLLGYDLVQSSIPIQGSYQNAKIRGMAVLEVDFEANKAYIRENIYGK